MVDDPILLAVEGFEEAVVPGSEDAGIRVFVEDRTIILLL